MKTIKFVALLMLAVFASCSNDDNDGTPSLQDNRLPADEVIGLLKSAFLNTDGEPIGVANGVESNRDVAVYGAYEAILAYSSTHEGIEFLLPYQEGQSFSYEYQLRENRGSISLKSSDKDGCYAEMTVRVPEFPQITKMRFLDYNAFWNENNSTESLENLINVSVSVTASIQQLFGKLESQVQSENMQTAISHVNVINEQQEKKAEISDKLQECRAQKLEARKSSTSVISDEMLAFLSANAIDYPMPADGNMYTEEEWDEVIANLAFLSEETNENIQQEVNYIQNDLKQSKTSYWDKLTNMSNSVVQTISSLFI